MSAMYPTDAVPVTVVKAIAEHVRAAVLTRYAADSCIASTAVFIDVGNWLGLGTSPVAVNVLAANPAALQVMAEDPMPPVDQWPPDAWTVGVNADQPAREGGWPGHLVAVLHGRRDRLVDVSADQFDRPARDLRCPSPALGRLPDGWGAGAECVTHLHRYGTMLRWDPAGDPAQQARRDDALAEAQTRLTRAGITPATFTPPQGVAP